MTEPGEGLYPMSLVGVARRHPVIPRPPPPPALMHAQGHVKEIVWSAARTGEHAASLYPELHDFLPADAPERLMPHSTTYSGWAAAARVLALWAVLATLASALIIAMARLVMARVRCWRAVSEQEHLQPPPPALHDHRCATDGFASDHQKRD